MKDIVEFITARLNEREAAALAAHAVDPSPWRADVDDESGTAERSAGFGLLVAADGVALWDCEGSRLLCMTAPTARHVALNDPAYVLADVAAKRAIVARHSTGVVRGSCRNADHLYDWQHVNDCDDELYRYCERCPSDGCDLRDHATIDAAHPDYDESWRP